MERTFTVMGVPIAMLSRESSPISSGSSNKKSTASDAHLNTFLLFQNSQQALKSDIASVLTDLMRMVYEGVMVAHYCATTPKNKWNAGDAFSTRTNITLQIPSVPDQEAVVRFYTEGWLK